MSSNPNEPKIYTCLFCKAEFTSKEYFCIHAVHDCVYASRD